MHLVNPLLRSPEVRTPTAENPPETDRRPRRTSEQTVLSAAAGVVLVVSVVLRFWTPSPMWLDEALTVNISPAPLAR